MATRPTTSVFGVKDVKSEAFVIEFARYLKRSGKIELPKYIDFVKTGVAKELAPYNPDWFYIRAAALARRCYVRPGAGVGAFRKVYSSSNKKGTVPEHSCKASGAIMRNMLQQLEKMGILEKAPNGGRRVTSQGRRDLDRIAAITAKKHRGATGGVARRRFAPAVPAQAEVVAPAGGEEAAAPAAEGN